MSAAHARRKVSNPLALAVLSNLRERPMHPYELSRVLREHGDARSIRYNHGSLYMVVRQLAKAGYIAEQGTTREGQRPERTVYALTDAGRHELTDWLGDLLAHPQYEYPALVSALALVAALPPTQVVDLLRTRLGLLAGRRREIDELIELSRTQGVSELFLVEEQYRQALLDTEATFLEGFIAQICDPQTPWLAAWAGFHDDPAGHTSAETKGH
ncbi:MAG TPA: PadR family transcriptional regulator [Jatrophihabitantaceae bacterium]|jgi:DNA-binding PadR family transcriptional regulator